MNTRNNVAPFPYRVPMLSILISPRSVIRAIISYKPNHYVLSLSLAFGVTRAFDRFLALNAGDVMSATDIFNYALTGGSVFGLLYFYLLGFLTTICSRILGGKANYQETRTAIVWSHVPMIWTLLIWFPVVIIFGQPYFMSSIYIMVANKALYYTTIFQTIVGIVAVAWTLILLTITLGEVNGFTPGKAIVLVSISLFFYVLSTVFVVFLFALIFNLA